MKIKAFNDQYWRNIFKNIPEINSSIIYSIDFEDGFKGIKTGIVSSLKIETNTVENCYLNQDNNKEYKKDETKKITLSILDNNVTRTYVIDKEVFKFLYLNELQENYSYEC